ncbi:MAG: SapC family protein [Magnetococcales bacterium]|nr:SapC family protein [Magnetococcales bacterium]
MNIKLEILQPSEHKELIYTPQNCYSNMAKRLLAPLLFSELIEASRCYPIIFYLSKGDEKLTPMALLGTEPVIGNISITKKGEWLESRMIPASLSSYPFYPGHIDENGQLTLLIDRNAPHFQKELSDGSGQPLFTPTGEATPTLIDIRKKHLNYQKEMGHTDWVVYKLYEKNLFQTKKLSEYLPGKKVAQLSNFFILDQKKLEELPDDDFIELRQLGLMANLYALITSQNNFSLLSKPVTQNQETQSYEFPPEVPAFKTEPVIPEKNHDNRLFIAIAVALIGIFTGVAISLTPSDTDKTTIYHPKSEVSIPQEKTNKTETVSLEKKPQPTEVQASQKEDILNILTLPPDATPSTSEVSIKQQDMELTPDISSAPIEPGKVISTTKHTGDPLSEKSTQEPPTATEVKPKVSQLNLFSMLTEQPLPILTPKKRPIGHTSRSPFNTKNDMALLQQQSPHINLLIDGIKRNITESRLSLPRGDNALEKVEQLKELNLDSPIVDELLNTVFERFLELAIWDRSGRAKLYLEKAGKIFPGDPRIEEIEGLVSE